MMFYITQVCLILTFNENYIVFDAIELVEFNLKIIVSVNIESFRYDVTDFLHSQCQI